MAAISKYAFFTRSACNGATYRDDDEQEILQEAILSRPAITHRDGRGRYGLNFLARGVVIQRWSASVSRAHSRPLNFIASVAGDDVARSVILGLVAFAIHQSRHSAGVGIPSEKKRG